VPNLESDIVGQVARLPLRPSEANALLPLHEAVMNALHAIQDRFGDRGIAEDGRIDIRVLREEGGTSTGPIIGFEVLDNGIGLNEDNYRSFLTPFSMLKVKRGGKGVGRLGWLKVFKEIRIRSA
jgi:C4-dicarboxylate-specific signal transduction histidine kinase